MSTGLLVARFGDFVQELAPVSAEPMISEAPFPTALAIIRAELNHHLIPLLLLSRSDADCAVVEREAISSYCVKHLSSSGVTLSTDQHSALMEYLRDFRPTRAQLTPALERLEQEPKPRLVALIEAARAVVDADGERRPYEVKILAEIASDLDAI